MRKVAFDEGVRLQWNGATHEIVAKEDTPQGVIAHLRRLPTKVATPYPMRELKAGYDAGELTLDSELPAESREEEKRRRRKHGAPLSDRPTHEQKRVAYRRRVIDAVESRLPPGGVWAVVGWTKTKKGKPRPITALDRLCAELGKEIGFEVYGRAMPCSAPSYYRWRNLLAEHDDQRDLSGKFDQRGRDGQVHALVKAAIMRVMGRVLEAAKYRQPVGRKPVVTMTTVMIKSLEEVKKERARHPELTLKLPCNATFYNYWNTFPAALREIARHGPTRARAMQRRPGTPTLAGASLSVLQFDETRLPFFVVHDELGIPLGRPWLALLVDEFSGSVVGFYLGFEPPGDLVIAAALRHSCLMKSYVGREYPDITNEYIQGGVARFLTFDNSLQAHGHSIHQITSDIDVQYDFTGSRSPWTKGEVEGTFDVANDTFLREMPGYVLAPDMRFDKHDYDPAKNAVIGWRHLLWLWHCWLIDLFHVTTPRSGLRMSPNDRWREGTRQVAPTFLERGTDLDFLFGIVREGHRLDHNGVMYAGILYYSDGIDILRRKRGSTLSVRCKVNPTDVSRIHVWDPDDEIWIPAFARDRGYLQGLSLHVHLLIRRHAAKLSGRDDLEAWIEARAALQAKIASTLPDAMTMAIRSKLARAMGIGTDRVFGRLDAAGEPVPALAALPAPGRPNPVDPSRTHTLAEPAVTAAARPAIPVFKSSRAAR